MRLSTVLVFCFATLAVFPRVALSEFKVATLDVTRVMNESEDAIARQKEIDKKQADLSKKFEERGKRLKETEQKIREGKLKDDSKEAREFKNEYRDYSREVKEAREDLNGDLARANRALAEKLFKVVQQYAKDKHISIILDKSEKPRGAVLFGEASFDITGDIVNRLND